MKQLIDILEKFKKIQETHTWTTTVENERAEIVSGWARPVAEEIMNSGYIEVHGPGYSCIRIDTLELYYNEEKEDGLKDPIMYHTNDRIPKHLKNAGVTSYPYFKFGSLHLHTSGIDITFENPQTECRASFLIRGFAVFCNPCDEKPLFKEDCSTKIYDFMFPNGIDSEYLSNIHWKKREWNSKFHEPSGRQNVFKYEKDDNGNYVMNDNHESFRSNKKEHCTRLWKFGTVLKFV